MRRSIKQLLVFSGSVCDCCSVEVFSVIDSQNLKHQSYCSLTRRHHFAVTDTGLRREESRFMSSYSEFDKLKQQAMSGSGNKHDMPSFYIPNTVFSFFGGIISAYIIFKLFKGTVNCLKVFTCGRDVAGGVYFKKLGKWAVVTGATDGIGKSYAEELADEGMDLVIISRSQEKLDKVAQEIRENSSVAVKTIAADFSRTDIYDKIADGLKDLDIGVLINNVGVSYTYPENFTDVPEESHEQMLYVNCLSVVKMMAMVLPGMKAKGIGAVVNVSSASGITPTPLLATYSASKVFVDFLSKAVNKEMFFANFPNIIIQSVTPFFVRTKLAGIRKSSFFVPEPNYFVRSALNTVGVWEHTYGCLAHEMQAAALSILPSFLVRIIFYRQLSASRARYLKRNKKSN